MKKVPVVATRNGQTMVVGEATVHDDYEESEIELSEAMSRGYTLRAKL